MKVSESWLRTNVKEGHLLRQNESNEKLSLQSLKSEIIRQGYFFLTHTTYSLVIWYVYSLICRLPSIPPANNYLCLNKQLVDLPMSNVLWLSIGKKYICTMFWDIIWSSMNNLQTDVGVFVFVRIARWLNKAIKEWMISFMLKNILRATSCFVFVDWLVDRKFDQYSFNNDADECVKLNHSHICFLLFKWIIQLLR